MTFSSAIRKASVIYFGVKLIGTGGNYTLISISKLAAREFADLSKWDGTDPSIATWEFKPRDDFDRDRLYIWPTTAEVYH